MSEHSEDDIDDIEHILENIRHNCVVMSERHKSRFLYLKGILRYFRIPIIILSGINSVIAVGLQPYIEQGLISVFTCLVSLVCGIIGSIELYLSIQTQMENELVTSKEYYLLGIEIYKLLSLKIANNLRLNENNDLPQINEIGQKTSDFFGEILFSPNEYITTK